MDTASSSWGFLGNEEGPGARTRGLTQLGASDGEAWGLVTSPVCVSESERQEEEAAAGQEEPLCSEDSGPQRLVRGRGVSRRQLWRGHSSDLAAQVGPRSGACGQCGLGGGHCAASGGRDLRAHFCHLFSDKCVSQCFCVNTRHRCGTYVVFHINSS